MTVEEKAKDIYFAMLNAGKGMISEYLAKECAIITVNEIMQTSAIDYQNDHNYWIQVLNHLKELK